MESSFFAVIGVLPPTPGGDLVSCATEPDLDGGRLFLGVGGGRGFPIMPYGSLRRVGVGIGF